MTKRSGLEMKRETGSGSGTASLVRASIRAAHYGNSRASERVLHPRRSARIVEPANNETRIELKVSFHVQYPFTLDCRRIRCHCTRIRRTKSLYHRAHFGGLKIPRCWTDRVSRKTLFAGVCSKSIFVIQLCAYLFVGCENSLNNDIAAQ